MNSTIQKQLEKIAFTQTIPFCYQCYKEAPSGRCKLCMSDDLMRLIPGVGCEYGTDWVISHLLSENLTPIDEDQLFEDMIEECYGETTQVAFMELSTIHVMKNQDPIYWNVAQSEYMDSLIQDEQIITFDDGNNYYWLHEIEDFITEHLEKA